MKKLTILFLLSIVALLAACSDDDTFTTSRSNLLSFSTDTLKLDTFFSSVPTSTRTFWVYNRSGAGLRLTNVRLSQGNQTGFRVNVSGDELNAANGYQVKDLEVRNKDSIRVFVVLLILIVLTTFQSDWNIFIPATYYYTEIQSTTNLGIKLLVCIWIMGCEFSLLPKLINLKEQNLV